MHSRRSVLKWLGKAVAVAVVTAADHSHKPPPKRRHGFGQYTFGSTPFGV